MTSHAKRHVANTWVFGYDGGKEIRVEEGRENITVLTARAIADAIYHSQGSLCADCHKPARFRIVHVAEQTVARCWDCNETATQAYGQRE